MTSRLLVTALLATAALGTALSAQAPTPNTLTPEEVSAGWVLLFDGNTPFGWQPKGTATWDARNGEISPVPGSGKGFLSHTTDFPNFKLHAEFWIDGTANSGVFLRCPTEGDISGTNAYEVNIYDKHEKWPSGSINEVAAAKGKHPTVGRWNRFDITALGDHLVIELNGKTTVDVKNGAHKRGPVALQYNGEGVVKFRNLKLQPLGLGSIFNGKDLTGWKVLPDHKSVYTVTPQGWMNVKNGNGDIQTEGQWKDFVFQLDVISNGKHLNSGVFFRAIPGQFWSGYESQIRNQWEGDDRSKPVDYGTGGVYNRQAARRVISTDGEWFTKTIVAHGRHMAVWVNGIQVSDYWDVRPPNETGRNGYREAAGVISLQGHDPTTDLSFRNLKIAEMP